MAKGCNLSSGSVLGAALSLAVTTMGAGILTLPSAYADAGIIPASALLFFVAYMTVVSVDYMVMSVDKLGLNSYEEITRELLGRKAEEIVRWMLLVYNTGAAIGYLVVISDLFEPMQPMITRYVPFLVTSRHTLLVFWVFIILPLSCIPQINKLHITSFLAIFSTCVITSMIVFRYFVPMKTDVPTRAPSEVANYGLTPTGGLLWWWGNHPLLALPIIMFSFDCQSLVFQIYAGLDNMRRLTMLEVSVISMIVTAGIHAAVGLFGYLANPHDVKDNIISNYDPNVDPLFAVGYVLYAIPINLAFVLLLFPIRDSIFILWYGFSSASAATHVPRPKDFQRLVDREDKVQALVDEYHEYCEGEEAEQAKENEEATAALNESKGLRESAGAATQYGATAAPAKTGSRHATPPPIDQVEEARLERELEYLQERKHEHNKIETIPLRDHLIVSISLSALCVAVAVVVPGIVSVVSFLGGLCSSTLCFTCPGLYRWRLHKMSLAPYSGWLDRAQLIMMLIFGVVGGVIGTIVAIGVVIA